MDVTSRNTLREIVARIKVTKIGSPTNGVLITLDPKEFRSLHWLETVIDECGREIIEEMTGDSSPSD